jgi:hypothetical protein
MGQTICSGKNTRGENVDHVLASCVPKFYSVSQDYWFLQSWYFVPRLANISNLVTRYKDDSETLVNQCRSNIRNARERSVG